jgi:hypothetical protein
MALCGFKIIQENCPQHSDKFTYICCFWVETCQKKLTPKILSQTFSAETEFCKIDPWRFCIFAFRPELRDVERFSVLDFFDNLQQLKNETKKVEEKRSEVLKVHKCRTGPIFRTFFPRKIPRKIPPPPKKKMWGKIGIFRRKSFK